ncbi:hypothetical protein M8C21_033380 [Ambrosia artemisiifolia]|uniref:F-box domain-containing protein n=1 Tax=Ambrosia artemisiifolia TaxID=4212 RepID=A0AAD5BPQ8_AMBAR|nr:hypothetical protein M8C21_033380 [Ambrosia artemisiifolia]
MSPSAGKHLPPEITEAILPLLPAKSLGRFKSVSKTWNSFISDPLFIRTHLLQSHQTRKLIALSTTGSLYSIHITETLDTDDNDIPATAKELSIGSPPIRWKEILGSCNGLVLAKDESDTIFLMNPTTKELWKVPLCPFVPPPDEEEVVYVMYGFGYDSSTDDYKILSISFWDPHNMQHDIKEAFECVYSLRNNLWRKLPEHDHSVLDGISGAPINQSLHWISRSFCIVGFNLATEEFNEMELPDSDSFHNGKTMGSDLVDFGGKLGVSMSSEVCTELCVMEEYGVGESWTTVHIPGLEKILWPVCLLEGRSREIVFQEKESKVVYNIDERRFRDVRISGCTSGDVNVFGGTFVESLESPKRIMIAS